MFLKKFRNISQQMLRARANRETFASATMFRNNVSATMFPRLRRPLVVIRLEFLVHAMCISKSASALFCYLIFLVITSNKLN